MSMSLFIIGSVFHAILLLPVLIHIANPTPCDPDVPSRAVHNTEPEMVAVLLRCDKGQYLKSHLCLPCSNGTFMTKKMAEERTHRHCLSCHEPGMYEIVLEPCTRTRDAQIMCEDQFYRSEIPDRPCQWQCKRCDVCGVGRNMFKNFERRECHGHKNTICCEAEDMVVVGDRCVRVPTVRTTSSTTTSTTPPEENVMPDAGEFFLSEEPSVGALRSGTSSLYLHYTYIMCSLLCVIYNLKLIYNIW